MWWPSAMTPNASDFMDPSTLGHYTYIENRELLCRWHDMYMEDEQEVRLHHFALVIAGDSSAYDPATIVPMG